MQRPPRPILGRVKGWTAPSTSFRAGYCLALALAFALAPPLQAIDREPWTVFAERRESLAGRHSDGLIVLFGLESRESRPSRAPFRQSSHFYYLTGCNEPGAALLIEPAGPGRAYRETLFLPPRTPQDELWHGRGVSPGDQRAYEQTGFARILARDELGPILQQADCPVYSLLEDRQSPLTGSPHTERLLAETEFTGELLEIRRSIAEMRMVKSPGEIRLLKQAVRATEAAHLAAWKRLRSGVGEAQLLGPMLEEFLEHGALYPAYAPIIGAGLNSTALHYSRLDSEADAGDVVLFDVAAEYGGYAADITRTVPVSGRFSERQRQVYDWVLGAQQAVIAAVKPGMKLRGKGRDSLHRRAVRYFEKQQDGLSDAFPHGIGHHVGLDVHDADTGDELRPGMVVTVEPGLYFPEERLGVRIEDMVLVTEEGALVLSDHLPKGPGEIERLLQQFQAER